MFTVAAAVLRGLPTLVLCAALLPAFPAHAQRAPVHTLTMPMAFTAADPAGGAVTFMGQVTFESQRIVDATTGDALLLSVILRNVPATAHATRTRYLVNVHETVVKPFKMHIPVEVSFPMMWQAGGNDQSPRSAVASWNVLVYPSGAVMTASQNFVRVN
jgi:hypothetical protein